MKTGLMCIAVLLAATSTICAAAPRVGIRIVSRTSPGEEDSLPEGPVPFREPMVYFQGPFTSSIDSLACLKENPVTIHTEPALLDLCHLKNVTYVVKKPDVAEGSEESESAEPETRKILGIFRGWKMDPISMRYKHMIFDDGDACGDSGDRAGFALEIVPTKNSDAKTRFYDFKQVGQCSFSAKLFTFVPVAESKPDQGIHTSGVLDISDAQETLPQVCGQMKCSYNTISRKVQGVMGQVRQVQKLMAGLPSTRTPDLANFTLSSSKSILRSSNTILERSLELLHALEKLQAELQAASEEANHEADASDNAVEEERAESGSSREALGDGSDSEQQSVDEILEVAVEAEG